MKSTISISVVIGMTVFLLSTAVDPACGRTWCVERDGSADYSVIQDAVDVAASGDTIRIGRGRFDEMQLFTCPGWSDSVMVKVTQHELTIIGSGPETIIGKNEIWVENPDYRKGIVAGDYLGNYVLRVQDLHIENMRDGIYTSYESVGQDTVEVSRCTFYANYSSLVLIGDGGQVVVSDCSINHMARDGRHIVAWRQAQLSIANCEFSLWDQHTSPQSHIGLDHVQQAKINNCEFLEGTGGMTIDHGGPILVTNCLFDGQKYVALSPTILSNLTVENCTFRNQKWITYSSTFDNQVAFNNCTIESVSDCAFYITHTGTFAVSNCDLSGGERGIVWCADRHDCFEPQTLDFTNNYWGTDEPDSIQAWIRDLNDENESCFYIDYEPYRSESTPVQAKSLSDINSIFRSQ